MTTTSDAAAPVSGDTSGSHQGDSTSQNPDQNATSDHGQSDHNPAAQDPTAASATAAQTISPAATAASPTTGAYTSSATPTTSTLSDLLETARATITTAAQTGVTSARIVLSPQSLGQVTITLTESAAGLTAHLAADHPETLRSLQQNAPDLRQSLQDSGVHVLALDVSSSGQQSLSGSAPDQRDTTGSAAGQRAGGDSDADPEGSAQAELDLTQVAPSGHLLDVLA